jgi:hypothetical protein
MASKSLRTILAVNVVLILLFVVSNYALWDMLNSYTHLGRTVMNPLNVILSMWGDVVDGNIERISGLKIFPNFPFWIFFLTVAINLLFIYQLKKDDKTKQ